MSEKVEFEEIVVKVPKRFMRLLEEKNYFDVDKAEWFTEAVRQGIYGELNGLEFSEMRRLEDKYQLDSKADEH
jgi:hypothetical protein